MQTFLTNIASASQVANSLPAQLAPRLFGSPETVIGGVSAFGDQTPHTLTYYGLDRPPAVQEFERIVICSPKNSDHVRAQAKIVTNDPRAAIICLLQAWQMERRFAFMRTLREVTHFDAGPARVDGSAIIGEDVIIGEGAEIGPGVTIYPGSAIGPRTKIRAGAVIGEEGIAVHRGIDGTISSQPHVGCVLIGEDSEIGANAVICRAMFGRTRIGDRVIIGNLSNIGHGATVGAGVWMSVGCLIGGHAAIGEGATIGMGAVVRDGVSIGVSAALAMGAVVTKSVADRQAVFGVPATPTRRPLRTGPDR